MVDPHQVLIENANNSTKISETQNLPTNLIQMNSSDITKYPIPQLQRNTEVQSVVNSAFDLNTVHENRQNVCSKVQDFDEIMCGPLTQNCPNSTIQPNDDNNANANAFINAPDCESDLLISNNFVGDIESIDASPNKVYVFVNNKPTEESNDSHSEQMLPSKSINSADIEIQNQSAEFYPNANIAFDNQIDTPVTIPTNKMDPRKVEPLRININRESIKTKIKLGPPGDRLNMSPSSSSNNAGVYDCNDVNEETHENQQSYPKITIKPIVKPPTDFEHHHHSAGSHMPSSSQEAIPKLKIKKVDSNNSNSSLTPLPLHSAASNNDDIGGNYQTHLLSESNSSLIK